MRRSELKAESLLRDYRIATPPIPVEAIARALGARLVYEPYEGPDDLSGLLWRKGSETVIGVNSSHPRVRQRFTVAHEIGHLLLHDGELFLDGALNFRDVRASAGVNPSEIEANSFASSLLLPRPLVEAELALLFSAEPYARLARAVEYLSKKFAVSKKAAELRLAALGLSGSI